MAAFMHSAVSFGTPDMPPPGLGSSIGPISLHNAIEDGFSKVELPLYGVLIAGCIDTGLPAGRRNFGQSVKTLIETANVHHARWVMFTETRCEALCAMLLSALPRSHTLLGGSVHLMRSVLIRATNKALQSSERSLLMLEGGPSSLAQSP